MKNKSTKKNILKLVSIFDNRNFYFKVIGNKKLYCLSNPGLKDNTFDYCIDGTDDAVSFNGMYFNQAFNILTKLGYLKY
jgi:hypothetical protein